MSRYRLWIVVLVSGFLGLMVDGMDLMFLSYSLPSLMEDLRMSRVQAGSLASYSLLGMALGGVSADGRPIASAACASSSGRSCSFPSRRRPSVSRRPTGSLPSSGSFPRWVWAQSTWCATPSWPSTCRLSAARRSSEHSRRAGQRDTLWQRYWPAPSCPCTAGARCSRRP